VKIPPPPDKFSAYVPIISTDKGRLVGPWIIVPANDKFHSKVQILFPVNAHGPHFLKY
jgi:polyphosphate kinase 2 (PPK2 family)